MGLLDQINMGQQVGFAQPVDTSNIPNQFVPGKKPGGGLGGLSGVLSTVGDLMAYGPFIGQAHARQARVREQDDMQQQIHQAQLAAISAKQGRNQILQGHNGAVFSVDPETNAFTELRAPDPVTPHKTALQENFDYYTSLPPEQQRLLRPMMGGFANTEEGQQQAIARASGIADAQGQARSRYRAPPGGVSPYGRTKANPLPVKSKDDYDRLPSGAWVSPAPGVVFQKR